MATDTLRVAVAGCHRMLLRDLAHHNFASAFDAVTDTDIVAVFDHGAQTRREFAECWRPVWGAIPTFDDYGQMLDEVEPDLLCIATRQTLHADQIEAAVAAGVRGILCDKPLATSLTEMDRIVAACAAVPLAFALDRRWYAAYCQLRQQLAAGLVGEMASLTAYGLPNAINHGCHWYDAVLGLMGDPEPQWVSGLLNDVAAEPSDSRARMDPSARLQIGMDNGAVAFVTAGGPKGIGFDIAGSAGRVAIYADATVAWHWNEGSDAAQPIPLSSAAEPWPSGPAMVADLVNAVRTGGRTACDIEQARRATEIGFALHNSSAAEGARVSLPAADRALRIESFPWGNEPA